MAILDPRIEAVRKEYGLAASDFWELPQKKGTWIAKHAALETAAAKAGITFGAPQVLEAHGETKCVALCVSSTFKDRTEWSIGEASPANNKNAYPYAMAEKRAKDRVVLKLIGLHGLAYSEDEADDFNRQPSGNGSAPTPPPPPVEDPDVIEGAKNYVAQSKEVFAKAERLPDLYMWLDDNGGSLTAPDKPSKLDRLKRKMPDLYKEIVTAYQARIGELSAKP